MNATRCENEDGMKHYNGTMNNNSMSDSKNDQDDSNENDYSTTDCQEQMQHSNGTNHTMKSDNASMYDEEGRPMPKDHTEKA